MRYKLVKALAKRAKSRLAKLKKVDPDVPDDPMATHKRRMTKRAIQLRSEARVRAGARVKKPPADVVGVRRARKASTRLRKARARLKPKNKARLEAEADLARRSGRFDHSPSGWRKKIKRKAAFKKRWGSPEVYAKYKRAKKALIKTAAQGRDWRYRKGGAPSFRPDDYRRRPDGTPFPSYGTVRAREKKLEGIVKQFRKD